MSLVFLSLAIAGLWINLLGAGLAARRFVSDYAVARMTGVLAICMVCFCLEHFAGWGPRPPLLPLTTALSVWLMWRARSALRENWGSEALFAAGFLYCLLWRYTFPDIDASEDKMPNFGLIEAYMRGTRLPPPDLWLSPFRANCYYSFQHYGASLLGRLLGVGPGISYHLAFCTMVGFLTLLAGRCFAAFCAWTPGRWVGVLSLLFGGSGAALAAHVLLKSAYVLDIVRFIGGSIVHDELTPLGQRVAAWMTSPGIAPRDLPMEPLSYFLIKGDFHPPLSGFLLLAFAAALIAVQETGASGRQRALHYALLAATLPLALISNAWILPLQLLLVGGWFLFDALRGAKGYLLPPWRGSPPRRRSSIPSSCSLRSRRSATTQRSASPASADHTPWLGWLITFWPVLGILILGPLNRERRPSGALSSSRSGPWR